jgi:hypothetical protein
VSLYLPFCRGLIHGYILKCLIIGESLFAEILFTHLLLFPLSFFLGVGIGMEVAVGAMEVDWHFKEVFSLGPSCGLKVAV